MSLSSTRIVSIIAGRRLFLSALQGRDGKRLLYYRFLDCIVTVVGDEKEMRIAFRGKAGSGKSALALYLQAKYGFIRLSFASPFKQFVVDIFGQPLDKARMRSFLQLLGNGAREIDQSVWIRHLANAVSLLPDAANIVVDDLRYANEQNWLEAHGFIIIELQGRGGLQGYEAKHVSENELTNYPKDYSINTSGAFEHSVAQLESVLDDVVTGDNFAREALGVLRR